MKTIFRAVLASCLVSAVLATKCCAPLEWEGRQYGAGLGRFRYPTNEFNGENLRIFYDADDKRSAIKGVFTHNSVKTEFIAIFNHETQLGYYILPNSQNCKIRELKKSFVGACIPDNAQLEGEAYIGSGDNTLEVRVYKLEVKDELYDIIVYNTVTVDGCIPVSHDTWGTYNGTNFFENYNFFNITPGITDENVFIPPPYCSETTVDLIADMIHNKYIRMMHL